VDYDRNASDYAQHRQVHPAVLRRLALTGVIGPAFRVLEVGCGTGNYILTLQHLLGPSSWGIDPSEGMLALAREASAPVVFQLGQAERLEFADDFFDLVFSVDVIHHVGDHLAYFREAQRVLKPGGKVCTVTDSEWIIRHRQPLAVYFPETVQVELGRYPGVERLRDLMEQAGFGQVSEEMVEHPYQLNDAQPYRDQAFSSLHLIPDEAFRRGIRHMEQDLEKGPIACVSRYVLLWGAK